MVAALSLIATIVASVIRPGFAAGQEIAPAARHFILLLDDSGDSPLRPAPLRDPASHITTALFARIEGDSGFDPSRDHLSVVFFQVLGTRPSGCFAGRVLHSVMPEGMFELIRPPLTAVTTRDGLAAYLRDSFSRTVPNGGCRFAGGGYSPIARSQRLVLPYVNRYDQPPSVVSRIYLVQASNRTINPLGDQSGSGENTQFGDQAASNDLHRQIDGVVSVRAIDTLHPFESLYVDRFRVLPAVGDAGEDLVAVPPSIELRRRAVSRGKIRLDTTNGSIRLRSSEWLVPITVTLVSESTPARHTSVDLERCAPPCKVVEQEHVVDVARAILPAAEIRVDDVLAASRLLVRARFRYVMPGIYDRLILDATPHRVDLQPEQPAVVPRSLMTRTPTVIDNRALAGAWRPTDSGGLDQYAAATRIQGARSRREAGMIVGFVFVVLVFVYGLTTHRRFDPALVLTPKGDRLDFNGEIPRSIEAITVNVVNIANAVLESLQRTASGPWTVTLDDGVSAIWSDSRKPLEGADPATLVTLASDGDAEVTRQISGRGESSVAIALDGAQWSGILPPTLWDGGPAKVRLSGTLQLAHADGLSKYPWTCELMVIPERTTAPHLLPDVAATAAWKAGEQLDLGSVVLASTARYRFAVPTTVRHVFELAESDRVLHTVEETIIVEGRQHVTLPLIAPEGTTPNPTYLEEMWTVRLYVDNQQPSEHAVRVRKDVREPEPNIVLMCGTGSDPVEIAWLSDSIRARQAGRPLHNDEGTIHVGATGSTVNVTRHDIPLVLCTAQFSLGKPTLGGQFTAELEAEIAIGANEIPVSLRVDRDAPEPRLKSFVVTAERRPRDAAVRIAHRDVFHVLQEQEIVEQYARIALNIRVTITEGGDTAQRHCRLIIMQKLARLEEGTILAIDFGNSAIAVATLAPGASEAEIADLQNVEILDSRTLAQEDPESPERGSPLIPSAFTIEFDRRGASNGGRPGTQWGPPPELLDGSDPRTISLPTLSAHYSQYPERVVQSIKHMLASHYDEITLDAPIRTRKWTLYGFKVDKLLTGVMKALAETYTGADAFERLVYTIPNTLLPWQERRVRAAIESAFTSAKPQWTKGLSESDAVMHRYLDKLPKNHRQELLLFYDFGSGTVDLTLARVTVDASGTSANIISRIGFDRAGSYLDQALTSIVHEKLTKALAAVPGAYREPLLGGKLNVRITNFASELAWAKRNWTVGEPLRISQHIEQSSVVDPDAWPVLIKAGLMSDMERRGTIVKSISIDWNVIHQDPNVYQFFDFIRNELVMECLRNGGADRQQITGVVVSGRGALWPGFIDALKSTFAASVSVAPVSVEPEDMKLAVVRGAASWLQSRHSMRVTSSAPGPTYLAFTDLDPDIGTWRSVLALGAEPVELPTGTLTLAAIDFHFDTRTLADMLRHPIGRLLVRILPSNVPIVGDRRVKAFVTCDDGRTTINIDDGFVSEVTIGGGAWAMGDWSAWNRDQLRTRA